MDRNEVYETCIRFVSELEGRESELDLANEVGIEIDEDLLARAVVHKLKQAIERVKKHPLADDQSRTLYHVALYAGAIRKPMFGISLCHIVLHHDSTQEAYRELAKDWLTKVHQLIPDDMYEKEIEETVIDIEKALDVSYEWLTVQEKHAAQPATKIVFNTDLIKKNSPGK